jgi:hypothetical protein
VHHFVGGKFGLDFIEILPQTSARLGERRKSVDRISPAIGVDGADYVQRPIQPRKQVFGLDARVVPGVPNVSDPHAEFLIARQRHSQTPFENMEIADPSCTKIVENCPGRLVQLWPDEESNNEPSVRPPDGSGAGVSVQIAHFDAAVALKADDFNIMA